MDTPTIKTELVELQNSLTSIKQQLERAFRALDRIGRQVEKNRTIRKRGVGGGVVADVGFPSSSMDVTSSSPSSDREREGTTQEESTGMISKGTSKRSFDTLEGEASEERRDEDDNNPPARKKQKTPTSLSSSLITR